MAKVALKKSQFDYNLLKNLMRGKNSFAHQNSLMTS